MRVLQFMPVYEPAWRYGGPVRSVSAQCKALAAAGADVTVYTTNVDGPYLLDVPTGQPLHRDGVTVWYFPGKSYHGIIWSSELTRHLKCSSHSFDLVHCSATWHPMQWPLVSCSMRNDIPIVLSARGVFNPWNRSEWGLRHKLYWPLIERRNYRAAIAVHYTAETERQSAEAFLGPHPSFVVPNGIDLAQHQRDQEAGKAFRLGHRIPDEAVVVLFVGRLHPVKGLDILVGAFADLLGRPEARSANPRLVLVGGDERGYRAELERLIAGLGIGQHVTFTGHLVGADLTAAFSAAELFVLPSHNENFGMSVVEAMAFGLPPIVTEGVNIASELASDRAALVVPYEEAALAGALRGLASDPAVRRDLAARAQDCVRRRYDIDAVAQRMLDEYEKIVRRSKRR